jgi:hypothetical protein
MCRPVLGLALLLAFVATAIAGAGCSLGPWGGPGYVFNPGAIGTGEQAIVPRNDSGYVDGMPPDCRTWRK